MITERVLYLELDQDVAGQCRQYQALFDEPNEKLEEAKITQVTMKGGVYGSEELHKKMGRLVNRVTKLESHGGDRKSGEYKYTDQAG